ncbi:MAG: hypothetical protein RIC35_05235 [Marinoscillum sp.]
MKPAPNFFQRIAITLFVGAVAIYLFQYFQGYDGSIGWNVTTTAESEEFAAYPFKKGPFEFSFTAEKYSLAESFTAGPIKRDLTSEAGFICLILLGLCVIMAVVTFLSRLWFIGVMALLIFFIISLHLPEIEVFGFENKSSIGIVIILCAYLIPGYLFHAFFSNISFELRLLSFLLVTGLIAIFSGVELTILQEQFTVGSYFGLVIIALIFLMLIAEENVFAILYLITRQKGGKSNHIHFIVFSLVYLGILGLYYGKKSGVINTEVAFFDPFILLSISAVVALWSISYREELYQVFLDKRNALFLLIGTGLVTFGFLSMGMFRGNDPVYEGLHYLIVYTHLGFGAFFFIYIVVNFITPLIRGLEVYKVAYKPQNFHYVSAKLGGLVAVAAFFYLSSKEPFLLFRAGSYNYQGAQAEHLGETLLAGEYYREGTIFGHDNHFSNYKIGYRRLQKQDPEEANYRFGRATKRYPSPQAYINQAGTYAMLNEATPSLIALKEGIREFPNNPQLQNNLGLTFADLGKKSDATKILSESNLKGQWTNANLVNLWKVIDFDVQKAQDDYTQGNLAVKTNILYSSLGTNQFAELSFDTTYLYPSYPLHRLAFLINASSYFPDPVISKHIERTLANPVSETIYWSAQNAAALSCYGLGDINQALYRLDLLASDVPSKEKGKYLNEMGMIALSEHALDEALRFFEAAIAEGSKPSLLNKQASLLEIGNMEKALAWSDYLISIDSVYAPIPRDLRAIQTRQDLSTDLQLFRLYYLYPEYSSAEISALLNEATDENYAASLWTKVSKELLIEKRFDDLKKYRAVFNPYLAKDSFNEVDLLVALNENRSPNVNHPITTALSISDTTERVLALKQIANQNALNQPIVLAITSILQNLDQSAAYEVLVKASDIHKSNVALRKQYVIAAARSGLDQYAKDVLAELKTRLTSSEFERFYQEYLTEKEALENSGW